MKNLFYLIIFFLPFQGIAQAENCDIIKVIDTAFLKFKKCTIVNRFDQLNTNPESISHQFSEFADESILKGLYTKASEARQDSFPSAKCLPGVKLIGVDDVVQISDENKIMYHIDPEIDDSIRTTINQIMEINDEHYRDSIYSDFMKSDLVTRHNSRISDNLTRIVFLSRPAIFENYALVGVSVFIGPRNGAYYKCLLEKSNGQWHLRNESIDDKLTSKLVQTNHQINFDMSLR